MIQTAYGKATDRSYFGGCSNGGRHTLVAASRWRTSTTDSWRAPPVPACLWPPSPTSPARRPSHAPPPAGDLETGFTAYRAGLLVANAVLAKCDALDGATDGLVQDTSTCQAAFDLGPRRADLRRRARWHLPVGRAEDVDRPAVRGRDHQHRQASTPVSPMTRHRAPPGGRPGNSPPRCCSIPTP